MNLSSATHSLDVFAGLLRTDHAAALSSTTDLTLASGATLDINGFSQTIAALAGAGTVLLESQNLTIGGDNTSTSFAGTITGANYNNASIGKTGTGTLTLSAATITGASLYVSQGGVAVALGATSLNYFAVGEGTGNTAEARVSGGTLSVSNAVQIGDFNGIGTFDQTGGTVALTYSLNIGNQGGTGIYNLIGGALTLGGASSLFDLGRNSSSHTASQGTLNLTGGQVDVQTGSFIIGDGIDGGAHQGSGLVVQSAGTFTVEAASAGLNLAGFGNGEYDLNGGVLQVGGTNLHAHWQGSGGAHVFALGGGTLQVLGTALTTDVTGMLTTATTTAIDTAGLGATWNGGLSGSGGLLKIGLATLKLAGANTTSGDITLSGGTLELGVATAAGTSRIVFQDGTFGVLRVDGALPTNVISRFVAGDSIDLGGLTYDAGLTTSYDTPTGVLSILSGVTPLAQLYFGAGNAAVASPFHLAQETGGGTGTVVTTDSIIPCFLAGTHIRTPQGDRRVETLAVGDAITTLSGNTRRIVWIGAGRTRVSPRNRCDVAPVIIRRGALADCVPYRDLVVTRHHAILVGDVLVPAEHLINGVSVLWDDAAAHIAYYHIELETHDILLAEGAPAESFRDDNSAQLFQNHVTRSGRPAAMPPCRDVVEAGAALEQAWRAIAARIGKVPDDVTTPEADLHLEVDGIRIAAHDAIHDRLRFTLPGTARDIAIVSRHAVPASFSAGPDLRRLGVALAGITLRQGDTRHVLPIADERLVDGFHAYSDGHRWTKGRAMLPRELAGAMSPEVEVELELRVVGTLRYRIEMAQRPQSLSA